MDQTRKRRLTNRKNGLPQGKVKRAEEPEDVKAADSRDDSESTVSHRRFTKIRVSSPQSDTAGQEQHTECSKTSEDDVEKALVITFDKEQGGTRLVGRRKAMRRKREMCDEEDSQQEEGDDEIQPDLEIDRELDRELENKSRQHKLTSANVRSIIHEVITNEHVVAMMKAAINETEPISVFEPKMTRSKLKEVVEKGVVIPAWNISPIKKQTEVKKGTQFVDIPLEEEDSSDEEYQPDEEDEDETAEETFLESDLESTASSPRGSRVNLHRSHSEYEEDMTGNSRLSLRRSRHLTVAVAPMGPPPPPPAPSRAPPDCSFLEKLHAVDEELAISTDCIEPYQSLSSTNGDESLISLRTRSKRPLRDVPLGRLEAELRAPDFTPDMYEFGSALEDREWTHWLQGLMISDMENEEEGDDEDDPEYNFLADIDEPDVEDYRNDKAVRITKKEVNDLMDELFDAFQDELGGQDEECHEEEEEKDEDENPPQEPPAILENIQYEDPLADVMKQRYRTVREQLAALRKHKALLESKGVTVPLPCPQRPTSSLTPMILSAAQKLQLQQQIQQHVQLLTQVNMLSSSVKGLETEASTSKQFLLELQMFAQRGEQSHGPVQPGFSSIFSASNLQGAISLLEELEQSPRRDHSAPSPCFPGSQFPAHLTWLMATRPVFLYLELLPTVPLRPTRFRGPFTSAEDYLVVLGHKHLRSTLHPLQMTCRYLLAARSFVRLKSHIRDACQKPFPSVIKTYFMAGKCPPMPLACKRVSPCEQRPPVEREKSLMPDWLKKNLKIINEHVRNYNQPSGNSQFQTTTSAKSTTPTEEANEPPGLHCRFPPGTRYPPRLPEDLSRALEASSKKKKDKPSESSRPSKPTLSAKELEEVLSQLPPILPKASTVASPSLSHPPHLSQGPGPQFQTVPLRTEPNPCPSANGAINCPIERPIIAPKVPPMVQSHGGVVVTLPTAPVTTELNSLRIVPVKNAVEMPMGISGAPKVAQIVANQGKVLITLPTAATNAPQLSSPSSRHVTVNQTGPLVASNVVTAIPAGSSQGGLIISLPPPPVPKAIICPTPIMKTSPASVPLAKDHISQRYGTLLKLIPRDSAFLASPKQTSGSQKPLNRFLLLPPGYVLARNNLGHQIVKRVVDQNCKQVSAPEGKQNRNEKTSDNSTDGLQGGPLEMSSIQGTLSSIDCLQEITEEEELNNHDGGMVENEVEEDGGEKDFRELFLMLSESSGSPAASIEEEDRDMEVVLERKLEKQKEKERKGSSRWTGEEEIGGDHVSEVGSVPELQKKVSRTGLEQHEGVHRAYTQEMDVERAFVLYNDTLDDDPHRDAKDVAFAQAYLEKVHEVLQAVPGKLKEFLGVLSEFEKDPESRTSLELLRRLKPMLADWPELLRDFAAFLHPDQARECGLLAEQQAFERSKRFLRQLERTFGEQSALYTKVVHILQGAPSWDLAGSREMKAQISSLFCDHTDLLEEFWVFFKQLYPQVQLHSEQNADHLSSVETIQGLKGSQSCPPIRTLSPERKVEPHKTAIKHRRMRDKHVQTEVKKHNARRSNVATELDSEVDEGSSSVDNQPSSFKCMENSVCAKNILHSPNGKKVVLWTREADRVILTTCRQRGAKKATFRAIAAQLGNKTTKEVLERFQDLIKLYHKSSKLPHTSQSDMEDQSSTTENEPDRKYDCVEQ
ncbi:GON-4-like protein isoform X2 [Myxocyprinus asiaticus]|uniref:GON-4-like protein isoform X2 n=1 Tax=Myxocyprinus asiaticus TaxID=70543 RepID=UPI002221CB27|nr:GON-4-like protein isoform X2 [Myxocyprinus asiaticus]